MQTRTCVQGRSQRPDFGGQAHLRGVGRHTHQGNLTFYIYRVSEIQKIRVPHSGSLGKKNLQDHQVDRK